MGPGEDREAPGRDLGAEQLQDQAEGAGDDGHDPGRVVRLEDVAEGVGECLGDDHQADESQDHERVAAQRQAGGPDDDPADDRVADADQHQADEHVGAEDGERPQQAADDGDGGDDPLDEPVGQVVAGGDQQDEEAPEHERVHEPGDRVA